MGHFYQERQCSVLIRVQKKQGGNKAEKGRGWWGKVLPSWGTDVQIEIQQRSNSRGRKRDGTGQKKIKNKMKTQQLWLGFIGLLPPVLYLFPAPPPPNPVAAGDEDWRELTLSCHMREMCHFCNNPLSRRLLCRLQFVGCHLLALLICFTHCCGMAEVRPLIPNEVLVF